MDKDDPSIIQNILHKLQITNLIEKFSTLSNAHFNSLLLEIMHRRTSNIAPSQLVKNYHHHRFSHPSHLDPVVYHQLEIILLTLAKKLDIQTILLSPVAPFASCSAFKYVHQHNVLSANRSSEVIADPTNMLAIIIADKIKNKVLDVNAAVHYSTTTRVVRAQNLPDIPHFYSHFGIFGMVSSGKDLGNYITEKSLLTKHISYYRNLLTNMGVAYPLILTIKKRQGYSHTDLFFKSITSYLVDLFNDISIILEENLTENHYYVGINFKMQLLKKDNEHIEIGDGGFVPWIAEMTNNHKILTLISGVGIERLMTLLE